MENISKLVPILFAGNEHDFNHNGLGRLHDATSVKVTEAYNSEFNLDMEYPVTGARYELIQNGMLIMAKPNPYDEPHLFRIYEHQLSSNKNNISIKAHSNTFDLADNLVISLNVDNKTPETAMNLLKEAAIETCDFTFVSDITDLRSVTWERRNLLNCITGNENSILSLWGGEIKHGNKRIDIYRRRGNDDVTTIRHGKNLKGFTATYSTKGLITAIVPYYMESIDTYDQGTVQEPVFGDIVRSPRIDDYPHTYFAFIEFKAEEHGREEYDGWYIDLELLNQAASTFFEDNEEVDIPSVSVDVQLEDLSQMADYEKYKELEKVQIADTITIYSEKYKVNIMSTVKKVVYDALTDKIINVEIGKINTTTQNYQKTYINDYVNKKVTPIINSVNVISLTANKKNKIFRGPDTPADGVAVENDLWYKPVGNGEIEMYIFNGAVWAIEKVSAGLLGGTLDATNGDVDLININAANINTGTLSGGSVFWNLDMGTFRIGPETHPIFSWDGSKLVIDLTGNSQVEDLKDQIDNISDAIVEQLEVVKDSTAETINDFNNDIHEELGAIDTSLLEYQQRMEALDGEGGAIELTTQEIENIKSTVVGVETILGEQSARWSFINNRIIEMADGNIWIGDGDATEDGYSTGILIGPNYDPATGLTKNRIAFYNQGVLTAYIQDGLMRIDHGIFIESATISNFKFEAISGTDILSISFVG